MIARLKWRFCHLIAMVCNRFLRNSNWFWIPGRKLRICLIIGSIYYFSYYSKTLFYCDWYLNRSQICVKCKTARLQCNVYSWLWEEHIHRLEYDMNGFCKFHNILKNIEEEKSSMFRWRFFSVCVAEGGCKEVGDRTFPQLNWWIDLVK